MGSGQCDAQSSKVIYSFTSLQGHLILIFKHLSTEIPSTRLTMSVCLSVCLSLSLSVSLSVSVSLSLSPYLSVCLSISVCLSVSLSR